MKTAMVFLLWMVTAGTAPAAVYKCTGAGGKVEFSDRPCAGMDSEPMALRYDASGDPNVGALQNQVAMGRVAVGMTASQVRQAWGEPDGVKSAKKKNTTQEEWHYRRDGKSQKVTLIDGTVVEVSSQASSGTSQTATKSAKSVTTTSATAKRAEKAGERRFIREGMTSAEVRSRIGAPDSQGTGTCRERTTLNSKKQLKTVRDLCETCWIYEPAGDDPQTRTHVCFQNGEVSSVERKVAR